MKINLRTKEFAIDIFARSYQAIVVANLAMLFTGPKIKWFFFGLGIVGMAAILLMAFSLTVEINQKERIK